MSQEVSVAELDIYRSVPGRINVKRWLIDVAIEKGYVFDVKRYAVDDGPGIRTTVFMKGCPLRCWWCHNPESQVLKPELMFKANRCIGCGECLTICQRNAISGFAKRISIDRKQCNLCGKCIQKCPADALMIVGKETNVSEVIREVERDRAFYEESHGGVTFSGGEPLMQIGFLNTLLEKCKDLDFHTAVDTSGYASQKSVDKIKNKVDLFLYDLKLMDDKKHRKYTGVTNKLILENFKRLANAGSRILVRVPVVPGINSDKDNINRIAEFMLLHNVKHINLLPYHRAGIEKYKSLGRGYSLEKTHAPSDASLRAIKERFEASGLKVGIGGE
jgi:pyruvate formate lyase activating enzyme